MKLSELLTKIQMLGLERVPPVVFSALRRDWWDRKIRPQESAEVVTPSDVVSTTRLPSGERFRFVSGASRIDLEVEFLRRNVVRLSWGNDKPPLNYALASYEPEAVKLDHQVSAAEYTLCSDDLKVSVLPDGGIRFLDVNQTLLVEMLPPEFCGKASMQRSLLHPTAAVYGLGERAAGLNLRPGSYQFWNTEVGGSYGPGKDPLYTCIPVCLVAQSTGSFLIFFENSYRGSISLSESLEARFEGGMLRYYFIAGTPEEVLSRYTELTGRPELPPRWALGYHHSKWGYKTAAEIQEVADHFEKYDLPISAIHIDIDYMQGFRCFTIDPERFPDMKGLTQRLRQADIHTVVIIDPGIKVDPEYRLYQEGMKGGYFCKTPGGKPYIGAVWPGNTVFPDFTDPAVREWWANQYQYFLEQGISGFWHDMNEPSSLAAWGEYRPSLAMEHVLEGRKGNHLEARNLYGLLMNRSGYEGIRRFQPEARPWFLSRSGWAGNQRYAWNWTGDIEATWEMLKQTIATVLNLGLSGQPYAGADTGGFSSAPSPELFLRWFQLSAFLPFFRTHSSRLTPSREPWTFGEPILTILRETLNLRYRLMPYLYSLAWESAKTGLPLARPLFWIDPSDPGLWGIDDAFMLGNALLIAPILEEGVLSRSVMLPKGDWYSLDSDRVYHGPDRITLETTLEKIPALVRGGSILPLHDGEMLTLDVYPSAENASTGSSAALNLYSDQGDGYPSGDQDWRLDRFFLSYKNGRLHLTRKQTASFPFPYAGIRIKLRGIEASHALVDGKAIPLEAGALHTGLFEEMIFIPPG